MPILKVSQISANMRNIEVTGKIVIKEDTKEVKTCYGPAKISWAILRDETGSIRLNLWRTQINAVIVGDVIRLVNAFVKVYGGKMELNIGSDGRIECWNVGHNGKRECLRKSFTQVVPRKRKEICLA